ncbi:hypothetical protein [Pseudonocardia sp. WMMC193]|uniref:hypothetical protein n=1 Tax=Pseudonocardia sp. WMMC193 TaxID=2911965 RepID=UPI001F3EB697|nr:hypothetical protein [Pseudonocardia sp. WMMC193]MCF7548503.1 hypothetical protein [Pseudonocardia sp. WMMC193]
MSTHVAVSIAHDAPVEVDRKGTSVLVRLGELTVACSLEQAAAVRDRLDDVLAGEVAP